MSTTQTPTQAAAPALPNPKQAYDHLFNNVHANAFFGRMAQRGYQPRTQKEANDYLQLAGKLRTVAEDPAVKAANDDNPIAAASADLDRALAAQGLDGSLKQASAQERDVAINNMAAQLAGDESIFNSVLSLKAAEAVEVAQQLGLNQTQAQA